MTKGFIPPHGGYQKLLSYQKAEIVYDATVYFCHRFLDKRDRTFDQMVQAARSGKQNIAEGSQASGAILAQWPVTAAEANFPMALDEPGHRLFVGCRKPAKLLVIDTESGKVVTSLDCCGDTDDVFYDAVRKRIYVSRGEGSVTVIAQADASHYSHAATIPTAPGARTSLFDPAAGRLYVAVPHRNAQTAEIRVFQAQP